MGEEDHTSGYDIADLETVLAGFSQASTPDIQAAAEEDHGGESQLSEMAARGKSWCCKGLAVVQNLGYLGFKPGVPGGVRHLARVLPSHPLMIAFQQTILKQCSQSLLSACPTPTP